MISRAASARRSVTQFDLINRHNLCCVWEQVRAPYRQYVHALGGKQSPLKGQALPSVDQYRKRPRDGTTPYIDRFSKLACSTTKIVPTPKKNGGIGKRLVDGFT